MIAEPRRRADGRDAFVRGCGMSKQYGTVQALAEVDLSLEKGDHLALWGANGAGKTTLIRCLLGVIPFEGDLRIGGLDPREAGKQVRKKVGFIPQNVSFPPSMTVDELAPFYGRLRGADEEEVRRHLETVDLIPHLDKHPQELSGGLRQRLALAIALLGEPDLLLFDEPTASLDVGAYREFVDLVRANASPDRSLIFSSHRIQEVRTLADRVLVLEDGRRRQTCAPAELEDRLAAPA